MSEEPEKPPQLTIKQERERQHERAFKSALQEAKEAVGPVTLTETDRRNGWTEETLRVELASAFASQALRVDPHGIARRKPMPRMARNKYRPHYWRGR